MIHTRARASREGGRDDGENEAANSTIVTESLSPSRREVCVRTVSQSPPHMESEKCSRVS